MNAPVNWSSVAFTAAFLSIELGLICAASIWFEKRAERARHAAESGVPSYPSR